MNPEDLYADLYEMASTQGTLADAASAATKILALPRYGGDPHRLARDIETVIDRIAERTLPAAPGPKKQAASERLKTPAEWYFSIKGAGQAISNRRIANGDPGGTARSWMDVGVIYRVAVGLLELWSADTATPDDSGGSYYLEHVDLARTVHNGTVYATVEDTLRHRVRVSAPGPHLLLLPFDARGTTLGGVSPDRPGTYPPGQLVSIDVPEGTRAAVVFAGDPGECLDIGVHHRARDRALNNCSWMSVGYRVDQRIGGLSLNLEGGWTLWEWHAAGHGHDPLHVGRTRKGWWSWSQPTIGRTYNLSGERVDRDLPESREVYSLLERARQTAEYRRIGEEDIDKEPH